VRPVCGSWAVNRYGRRLTTKFFSDYLDPPNTNVIVLPSHFALESAQLRFKGEEKSNATLAAADDHTQNDGEVGHASYLLELPAEILIQIFRLLLPEGEVFHFSPITKSRIRGTSIHRLVPIDADITDPQQDRLGFLPAVSLICRRLTDIAYTLFFRNNQFVFEIATVGLTSVVYRTQTDILSYNKVISATPRDLAPLGPIGAKYLTSLTLSVTLTSRMPTRYEGSQLEGSVQRIASFFEGAAHNLKSLATDIGYGNRTSNRVATHRLEVSLSHSLRMHIRSIDSQSVNESRATKARVSRHTARLVELIAPLMCLGVEDVQISGLLSSEDIRAYKDALLKGGKRMHEKAAVGPPAKKQRVS
jgi:hypothetical protein